MFYAKDILQKRNSGKFSKIWLAATGMSKITRRDVANINVERSCDDIMAYVLPGRRAQAGGSIPRLSLYLSAQLMYGTVKTYQKQVDYLLLDVESTFLHVNKFQHQFFDTINLIDEPRKDLVTLPECLTMPDEMLDVMPDVEPLPTPRPDEFWGTGSNGSRIALSDSKHYMSPRGQKRSADVTQSPHTVASAEEITLKEALPLLVDTPLSPIPVPKDMELPMMTGQDMDLLMNGMAEEPQLSVSDLLPTSTPAVVTDRPPKRRRGPHTSEDKKQTDQEKQQKTPQREPQPAAVPEPRVVPPSPGVTVITSPLPRRQPRQSLDLELTPMTPSPARRRRKRQLTFADAETQIPKGQIKKHLTTGLDTCQPFLLQDIHGIAANDYFNYPGRKELSHQPHLRLWRRNAKYRTGIPESQLAQVDSPVVPEQPSLLEPEQPLQPVGEMPVELGSLQLSPVLPASEVRLKKRNTPSNLEKSLEALRSTSLQNSTMDIDTLMRSSLIPVTESELHLTDASLLNTSRQSKDDSISSNTRRKKTRLNVNLSFDEEQLQQQDMAVPANLYGLTQEPGMDIQNIDVIHVSGELKSDEREFLRIITEDITHQGTITFWELCPHEMDRKMAAKHFNALLNLCAKKILSVVQVNSFGDIIIRKT